MPVGWWSVSRGRRWCGRGDGDVAGLAVCFLICAQRERSGSRSLDRDAHRRRDASGKQGSSVCKRRQQLESAATSLVGTAGGLPRRRLSNGVRNAVSALRCAECASARCDGLVLFHSVKTSHESSLALAARCNTRDVHNSSGVVCLSEDGVKQQSACWQRRAGLVGYGSRMWRTWGSYWECLCWVTSF